MQEFPDQAPATNADSRPKAAPAVVDRKPGAGWAGVAAILALLLAAAALTGLWLDRRQGMSPELTELREQLTARASATDALGARLDEISAARRRLDDDIDRLNDRLSRDTESLSTLPGRVAQIEQTMDRFVNVGDRVRSAWLLSEAEHYLRIANAQLGLAGDTSVAQTALGLADDTLRELADPRMTKVRKLLAEDMSALRATPQPDTEGIVLTLGTLASSLDSLPLKRSAPDTFRRDTAPVPADLTGVDRALAVLRKAAGSLLSVRRAEDPITPLLSDAERTVLIRSLDLELQLARLAVMRGDAGMFRRSIEAAAVRLEQHFDVGTRDVQAAIETLQELGAADLPDELPDISRSLAALLEITGQAQPE
jgi:uroporphyrin-3 C-methyltransferase